MWSPDLRSSGRLWLPILQHLDAVHSRPDQLLEECGLQRDALSEHQSRVSLKSVLTLMREACRATDDLMFPMHAAERYGPETFDLTTYLVASQPHGGAAARTATRYAPLAIDGLQVHLNATEVDSLVSLSIQDSPISEPFLAEYLFGVMSVLIQYVFGGALPIAAVRFAHAPRTDERLYREWFKAPVHFRGDETALLFATSYETLTTRRHDRVASELLQIQAESALSNLPSTRSYQDRVLRFLRMRIGEGPVTIEEAAASLRVSARTLRRRLRAEGTSYSEVVDGFRSHHTIRLLADRSLSLEQIAVATSFSSAGALRRAFHRWFDESPRSYRRRISAEPM